MRSYAANSGSLVICMLLTQNKYEEANKRDSRIANRIYIFMSRNIRTKRVMNMRIVTQVHDASCVYVNALRSSPSCGAHQFMYNWFNYYGTFQSSAQKYKREQKQNTLQNIILYYMWCEQWTSKQSIFSSPIPIPNAYYNITLPSEWKNEWREKKEMKKRRDENDDRANKKKTRRITKIACILKNSCHANKIYISFFSRKYYVTNVCVLLVVLPFNHLYDANTSTWCERGDDKIIIK